MSLSNVLNGDLTATWKDVSAYSINANTLSVSTLAVGNLTATGTVAAATLTATGQTTTNDLNVGDTLTLSSKYISPLTDINPAPSIAIGQTQGYIQLNPNIAFPTASTIDVTLTSASLFADSIVLLSSGPSAANPSLDYHLKSLGTGSCVITVSNITGGSVVGTFAFQYVIL